MHAFTGIRKISPHLCPAKISVGTGLAEFSKSRACIESYYYDVTRSKKYGPQDQ